jgi:hypothetical protein
MVRPLAIETTRFDSIFVGCAGVVREGGQLDRNNVGFLPFPVRSSRPGFPASGSECALS